MVIMFMLSQEVIRIFNDFGAIFCHLEIYNKINGIESVRRQLLLLLLHTDTQNE